MREYGKGKGSVYNNAPLSKYKQSKLHDKKPGEKTEAEIRAYGTNWGGGADNKKKKEKGKRKHNPYDAATLELQKIVKTGEANQKRSEKMKDNHLKSSLEGLLGSLDIKL